MQKTSAIIATTTLLIVIPTAIAFESSKAETWKRRLFLPIFAAQENLHTPLFPEAEYLPPHITKSLTVGGPDKVIAVASTTTINQSAQLTLLPGTILAFHEHAKLIVRGDLTAVGSPGSRILFVSNEHHTDNKSWGGVEVHSGGTATVKLATFLHGNPGISCLEGSQVTAQNVTLRFGNVGVYAETNQCTIADSQIHGVTRSVVAPKTQPALQNTQTSTRKSPIHSLD